MRKIGPVARIFFLLLAILALPCSAQSFEYLSLSNSNRIITIQAEPAFVAAGDRASIAVMCKPVEGFVCVESDWFNFAIPLKKSQQQGQWTFKGYAYHILATEKVRILGNEYKALRIESIQGDKKFTYIYSNERGLIGFSAAFDGEVATFISARSAGFGAQ